MAFQFGLVDNMDPTISLLCFLGVIFFVLFFEYCTGVLEFFLEESHLYNRMVQQVYKELMMMGLMSFVIIMFEAAKTTVSSEEHEVIIAIDFAHIILFYLTMFFVVHAFFLIKTSISTQSHYRRIFAQSTKSLLDAVEVMNMDKVMKFFFELKYLPLSSLRDRVEYNLIHTIFNSKYLLPEDFDFAAYLSQSYARYSLRLINRSLTTWFVLFLLVIINYIRIKAGFNCHIVTTETAAHRMLGGSSYGGTTGGTTGGTDSGTPTGTHTDDHLYEIELKNDACHTDTIRYFLLSGAVLLLYNVIVVYFSRVYKIRMIHHAGAISPEDCVDFLRYKVKRKSAEIAEPPADLARYTIGDLKEEIEHEIQSNEFVEDEEGYRFIGQSIIKMNRFLEEYFAGLRMNARIYFTQLFCPNRLNNADKAAKDGANSDPTGFATANPRSRLRTASNDNFSNDRINRRRTSVVKPGAMTHEQLQVALALRAEVARRPSRLESQEEKEKDKEKVALRHRLSRSHRQSSISAQQRELIHQQQDDEVHMIHEGDEDSDSSSSGDDEELGKIRPRGGAMDDVVPYDSPLKENESRDATNTLSSYEGKTGSTTDIRDNDIKTISELLTASAKVPSGKTQEPEPYCVLEGFELYRKKKIIHDAVLNNNTLSTSQKKAIIDKETVHHTEPTAWYCLPCVPVNQILPDHKDIKSTADALSHSATFQHEFSSIYLFSRPVFYFRAVEFCIMFNCFYMAIWCTNMITISFQVDYDLGNTTLTQFIMIIPFVFGLVCLKFIAETASLLLAISELNIEVVYEVLKDMEETDHLVEELRLKIMKKALRKGEMLDKAGKYKFIAELFKEIDKDGSGLIDKDEFRALLRRLNLTYTDKRFTLLFLALDGPDGDGKIPEEALREFVFPDEDFNGMDDEEMYELPPV